MPCFRVQGDLQLTDDGKRFVFASGMARLVQRIRVGFQMPAGTWRWDTSLGMPLFNVEKLTPQILKAWARSYLLGFPEIVTVPVLTVVQSGSIATITYKALVNTGEFIEDAVPTLLTVTSTP